MVKLCIVGRGVLSLALAAGAARAQYIERVLVVGRQPVAMALDSVRGRLFVACQQSNAISVIDPDSNRVLRTISVGVKPVFLLARPDAGLVYAVCQPNSGNGSIRIYDTGSYELVGSIGVGRGPVKVVYDRQDDRMFCLNRLSPSVSVIRCDSNRVVRNVSLSQTPEDICYHPAANKVYVASGAYMQPGKVTIINAATGQTVRTINSGEDAWRLAGDPVADRVYCSNRGTRTISVISGAGDSVVRTLATESEVWSFLLLPDGRLYCGNYFSGTISVLRRGDTAFARTFPVAGGIGAFGYDPVTEKVYACGYLSGRVTVIECRNGDEVVLDSIVTGYGPAGAVVWTPQQRVFVCNSWDSTVTVIRDELTGMEETEMAEWGNRKAGAVFVRGTLFLPAAPGAGRVSLFDTGGREVMALSPGPNDLSRLAPGVYLLRGGVRAGRVVRCR